MLDLISAPAYVTDRWNRVRAVNLAYAKLVGDPTDGRSDEGSLFTISFILGRFRSSFPRRLTEVAGCAPTLSAEIEAGRLDQQTKHLWFKALALDPLAARQVGDVLAGHASRKWDGLVVFRSSDGKHSELRETVIPLSTMGLSDEGPIYLNVWMQPEWRLECSDLPVPTLLSPRQREIASLYALGHTSREVAEIAGISLHTARDHRDNIYGRLGINSRAELAAVMLPHPRRS